MSDETVGSGADGTPSSGNTAGTVIAREEGASGARVIKLVVQSHDGTPMGKEADVGRTGFNNHSPSINDRTETTGDGHTRTVDVAWVEAATGDTSGAGRIMWQRFAIGLDAANDNSAWAAGDAHAGAFGCEPSVAGLTSGETLLTWIGEDGHARGHLYPPDEFARGAASDPAAYAAVNAALGDLGPVAATADGHRRLQTIESRPGNLAVMWLALADHGFVMRGSMFTTPLGPGSDDDRGGESPIADIRTPPGFTGAFSLQAAGDGSADVIVTYGSSDANGIVTLARRIEGPSAGGEAGHAGPEFETGSAEAGRSAVYVAPDSGGHEDQTVSPTTADGTQPLEDGSEPLALVLTGTGAVEATPIVTELQDGFAVTWQTPGASAGTVAIRMAMFDADGTPRTFADGNAVITVTDDALAAVAPSIANVGSGAAVAYVDAGEGSLVVKAYDGDGAQVGGDVVVDTGASGAIGEIALDSGHGEDSGHEDELTVVYVRDDHDDQPDYGNVVLQRYRLPAEDADTDDLVALGCDGQADGADDPLILTASDDTDPTIQHEVIGRAPTVAGLDDGELAVVWVENDGAQETIKGRVLEADGDQVLQIDLTSLLQDSGIAKGTKPILLASDDGDILVSWLQRDGGSGGYVVMAAEYQASGPGQWIAPEAPVRLQELEREPKDFSVTWADADGAAIDVTWRLDSSGKGSGGVMSQRYDLDGNDVGRTKTLSKMDSDDSDAGTLSTAGLVDGQIVVVYTEQDKNGRLDLETHVVDTEAADGADASGVMPDAGAAEHAAAASPVLSTGIDQEIAINVATSASAGTVSRVNGVPITTDVPVDVGAGWVQLREDGHLTLSPDAGYAGTIAFDYTMDGGKHESDATGRVTIEVTPDAPSTVALVNAVTSLSEDVSTADDIRLADIAVSDGEVSTERLSLAGLDADLFKIVGSTLYLKAGIDLDFDTQPTLNVAIGADGRVQESQAVNFTLDVNDAGGNAAIADPAADSFMFAPGFGAGAADDSTHEVIDVSASGYSTLQELLDSGALVQAGADVVLTFDPTDPGGSDKITLRGIDLSVLTSADFKF